MPEVLESLERPLPLSPIYEEFNISPARSPHNIFAGKIYSRLDHLLEDTQLMPLFYETIGVHEYFVGEPAEETGTIIRAYRLQNSLYEPIPLEDDGYFCEMIGHFIPKTWEI